MSIEGKIIGNEGSFNKRILKGKKFSANPNLQGEISDFIKDGKIDKVEDKILKNVLLYNINIRKKEREVFIQTTKDELEKLIKIPGLSNETKSLVNIILGFESNTDKNTKYPSIKNKEELLKIFNDKDITKRDIDSWNKKGWKSVRVHYESGTKSTRVSDLENFYNNEFLVKSNEEEVVPEEANPEEANQEEVVPEEANEKTNEILFNEIKKLPEDSKKSINTKFSAVNELLVNMGGEGLLLPDVVNTQRSHPNPGSDSYNNLSIIANLIRMKLSLSEKYHNFEGADTEKKTQKESENAEPILYEDGLPIEIKIGKTKFKFEDTKEYVIGSGATVLKGRVNLIEVDGKGNYKINVGGKLMTINEDTPVVEIKPNEKAIGFYNLAGKLTSDEVRDLNKITQKVINSEMNETFFNELLESGDLGILLTVKLKPSLENKISHHISSFIVKDVIKKLNINGDLVDAVTTFSDKGFFRFSYTGKEGKIVYYDVNIKLGENGKPKFNELIDKIVNSINSTKDTKIISKKYEVIAEKNYTKEEYFKTFDNIKKLSDFKVLFKRLILGGTELEAFQEYINKKFKLNIGVDGIWGDESENAVNIFAESKGFIRKVDKKESNEYKITSFDRKFLKKYKKALIIVKQKTGIPSIVMSKLVKSECPRLRVHHDEPGTHAYGLTQIIPSTWKLIEKNFRIKLNKNNATDQLIAGALNLKMIMKKRGCSFQSSLAYHNTGDNYKDSVNRITKMSLRYFRSNPAVARKLPRGYEKTQRNYFISAIALYNDLSFNEAYNLYKSEKYNKVNKKLSQEYDSSFLENLLTSDEDLKFKKYFEGYKELKKLGILNEKKYDQILKKHGIEPIEFKEWLLIHGKKQFNLKKIIGLNDPELKEKYGKGGMFEGNREKDIPVSMISNEYKEFIKSKRVDKMTSSYRKDYINSTENVMKYEMPEEGFDVLNKFKEINLSDVINSLPKQFVYKSWIRKYFGEIKKLMLGGALRSIKDFHHNSKFRGIDVSKIPVTVNVPMATYKGGRKNVSLSFTYDPRTKKIHTELWSYSFHKNWSNVSGSGGTALGTNVLYLKSHGTRITNNINTNASSSGHAMYGFVIRKDGLDKTNNNNLKRGNLTHSVISNRRGRINSGNGTTTLGCTAYATLGTSNIYKKSKTQYAIEETTYPVL